MPVFTPASKDAMNRLVSDRKGWQYRQVYRDALEGLKAGQRLEIAPEDGESLRKVKVAVARAAKESGVAVAYGVTTDGTLLVWVKDKGKAASPH